jgi:hypothetical protein
MGCTPRAVQSATAESYLFKENVNSSKLLIGAWLLLDTLAHNAQALPSHHLSLNLLGKVIRAASALLLDRTPRHIQAYDFKSSSDHIKFSIVSTPFVCMESNSPSVSGSVQPTTNARWVRHCCWGRRCKCGAVWIWIGDRCLAVRQPVAPLSTVPGRAVSIHCTTGAGHTRRRCRLLSTEQ